MHGKICEIISQYFLGHRNEDIHYIRAVHIDTHSSHRASKPTGTHTHTHIQGIQRSKSMSRGSWEPSHTSFPARVSPIAVRPCSPPDYCKVICLESREGSAPVWEIVRHVRPRPVALLYCAPQSRWHALHFHSLQLVEPVHKSAFKAYYLHWLEMQGRLLTTA